MSVDAQFQEQTLTCGSQLESISALHQSAFFQQTFVYGNADQHHGGISMAIACFIRYEIDPFQRDAFEQYGKNWGRIIPRCGGHLVGYFLPHEGTNNIAWALIAFESLAAYEIYRARLKSDPEGGENFAMAEAKRFILREERTFATAVEGTLCKAALSRGEPT